MFYIPPGILENRKYGYARMDVRQKKTRNLLASFHDRVHWLGGRKDQRALNNYFLHTSERVTLPKTQGENFIRWSPCLGYWTSVRYFIV